MHCFADWEWEKPHADRRHVWWQLARDNASHCCSNLCHARGFRLWPGQLYCASICNRNLLRAHPGSAQFCRRQRQPVGAAGALQGCICYLPIGYAAGESQVNVLRFELSCPGCIDFTLRLKPVKSHIPQTPSAANRPDLKCGAKPWFKEHGWHNMWSFHIRYHMTLHYELR